MVQILEKIERGEGEQEDLDRCSSRLRPDPRQVLCALGEFAVDPVASYIANSATSSSAHIHQGRCPFGGNSSLEGILAPSEQHHHRAVENPLPLVTA